MENQDLNIQKGIRFEATFGQFMSAILLIVLMFVVPVVGYEYLNGGLDNSSNENMYSVSSLQERGTDVEGRVAGISTSAQSGGSIIDSIEPIYKSKYIMFGAGGVLISISIILSAGMVYDYFYKK